MAKLVVCETVQTLGLQHPALNQGTGGLWAGRSADPMFLVQSWLLAAENEGAAVRECMATWPLLIGSRGCAHQSGAQPRPSRGSRS